MLIVAIVIWSGFVCHAMADNKPFGTPVKVSPENGFKSLAAGDLDGDGDDEIVAANPQRGFIAAFFYVKDDLFSQIIIDDNPGGTTSVKTADFDNDGDLDVLSSNPGLQTITWLENSGTKPPTFTKHVISAVERETRDVSAADLDGDGDMDVAEVKYDGDNVVWFENEGTTFTRHVIDRELDESVSVSTADINGDGAMDIIACAGMKNKLMIYLNNAAHHPTFTPLLVSDTLTWTVRAGAADFDHDGDLDLYGYGQWSSETAWFQNNGEPTPAFLKHRIQLNNYKVGTAASVADYDLDGWPDIVTGLYLFRNNDGTTTTFSNYYIGSTCGCADSNALARINGDAYPDLVWASGYLYWAKNRYLRLQDLTPINRAPETGQVVSVHPRLALDKPDYMSVHAHTGTQWQVAQSPDFSNIVYDSGYTAKLQQIVLDQPLQTDTTYYFRARRQFADGETSWSKPTSFRTVKRLITVSGVAGEFGTIDSAMNYALRGTIVVPRGLYTENIHFRGRNFIVQSEDPLDTGTVAATIIDGDWKGPVVTFGGVENESCRLAGFTIRHGWSKYGGGVYGHGCTARIEHNVITLNTSYSGGGAGISHCQGLIQFNEIIENQAIGTGGGLFYCNGEISNNLIARNTGSTAGGLADCKGVIHNNEIAENHGHDGGGLHDCNNVRANIIRGNVSQGAGGGLYGCIYVHDNLIIANSANDGGAFYQCADIKNNTIVKNTASYNAVAVLSATQLINCIIWDNHSPNNTVTLYADYSCVDVPCGGVSNISADPQFVNEAAGDYRLKETSPCIDAGKNSGTGTDINGAPHGVRVVGGRGDGSNYDIGAYEYIPNDVLVNAPQGNFFTGTDIRVTGWFYTPTVGSSVRIELWQNNQKVAMLGMVYSPGGIINQAFTLPGVQSGSYQVRAISLSNPALADAGDTPITITHKNAVRGGDWEMYR